MYAELDDISPLRVYEERASQRSVRFAPEPSLKLFMSYTRCLPRLLQVDYHNSQRASVAEGLLCNMDTDLYPKFRHHEAAYYFTVSLKKL